MIKKLTKIHSGNNKKVEFSNYVFSFEINLDFSIQITNYKFRNFRLTEQTKLEYFN